MENFVNGMMTSGMAVYGDSRDLIVPIPGTRCSGELPGDLDRLFLEVKAQDKIGFSKAPILGLAYEDTWSMEEIASYNDIEEAIKVGIGMGSRRIYDKKTSQWYRLPRNGNVTASEMARTMRVNRRLKSVFRAAPVVLVLGLVGLGFVWVMNNM